MHQGMLPKPERSPRLRGVHACVLLAFLLNGALTSLYSRNNPILSRKYQTLATPAGWAFSIWALIFLSEAVFCVAQLLPQLRGSEEVAKAGPPFAFACLFQAAWSFAFGNEYIYTSQALILLILLALWRTNAALHAISKSSPPSLSHYILLYLPFAVHFGWLTAASIVSLNVSLVAIAPSHHAWLLALAVISLTCAFVAGILAPDSTYTLTISWALAGVSSQLKSPLDEAPEADPIKGWCPPFVTEALSGVAIVLACALLLIPLVRAVMRQAGSVGLPATEAQA